jgi:AraC-like DNA-binding protein
MRLGSSTACAMNIRTTEHQAAPVRATLEPGSATVIAGYGLAIAKALEHYGVDGRRVLAAAGISESLYNDPLKRLPFATITRLYDVCTRTTGDPYFGLTVARCMQVSTLHALGFGLLASTSLMDFCARVQRYFHLVSQSARVEIVMRGAEVHFRSVPLVAVSAQTQDAWLGMMCRLMRMLYREDFRPLAVEFAHAMPDPGDDVYVRFFSAPVRFDCDAATLVLSRADMDASLHGACPELAQFNDNLAANYIAKLDRSDTVTNVRARIVELLPSGTCTRSDVATALCMSTSGLQQRLMERGTSFHALLNDIRRELACGYLRQSGVSVTEITFLLGFSDVSNFTRAFKRWTGASPTRFRASLRTMSV